MNELSSQKSSTDNLTQRELEISKLVAEGLSIKLASSCL